MTLKATLGLIAADTKERYRLEEKRYTLFSYVLLLLNPHALAVVIYRFQHWLHTSGWPTLAEVLRQLNIVLFTTDIGSAAVIGEHFMVLHSNGITVGNRVRIGRNFYLIHHNTVDTGPRFGERPDDCVVIDDNVIVGCGARILGNITIGHDTFLGAGAVVTESLPECSFCITGPGETLDSA